MSDEEGLKLIMKGFFIGEIARRFGLNPRTIRYYETTGILPKAQRTESGYRIYTDETLEILGFILKAKALGLRLEEIKEILVLHRRGERPCPRTRELIEGKIREVDEGIAKLKELKRKLVRLQRLKRYKKVPAAICPIIT